MSKYVVKASMAHQPSSRKWRHNRMRVGVMEMQDDAPAPKILSERARGCLRVVRTWEDLYQGTSDRDQYSRAWKAACDLAKKLEGAQ